MSEPDSRNLQKYPPILFDEARRREFIDPDPLIAQLGVKSGAKVADFGAGAGFFTTPLAKAAGKKGVVYAVDINPNNLSIIRGKAKHDGLEDRIELVQGNVESGRGVNIKAGTLDLVVLSSVLSQFEEKTAVIETAEKLLSPRGKLAIFEWHQRGMLLGPPPRARIAKETVINLLFEGNQWRIDSDLDAGFYHYCLIFNKRPAPVAKPAKKAAAAEKQR